jgi:GntR family transcriptional regulator, transcriptional repressor for pyruvate dehydrogenase complex
MLKPVKRTSLIDTIIGQLMKYVQNDLNPGDKLMSERELMENLGVGRSSLREAIRALEVMGIVETRAGEGTFVAGDTSLRFQKPLEWGVFGAKKTVSDVFEARRTIEIAIMPLIAEKITSKQIEEIQDILAGMEEKKEEQELQAFLDLDYLFHKKLAEYTRNDILKEVVKLTYRIMEEERKSSLKTPEDYEEALGLHRVVADALSNRDGEKAAAAMRQHMDYTKKLLKL